MKLTKEVLKQMRNADDILFQHDLDDAQIGHLIITKEIKLPGIDKETIRKDLPIESRIKENSENKGFKYAFCSCSIYCKPDGFKFQYHSEGNQFETILCCLRENDDISLLWYPDTNNQNENEANLHHDRLILIVKRKENYLSFLIYDNVYKDNSSRMIRHHRSF
jgi:hypothetical protein